MARLRRTPDLRRNIQAALAFMADCRRLLTLWALGAIVVALCGWSMLHRHLEQEREVIESAVLREAVTLARAYSGQLAQTIDAIDQILLHVRYEWLLSNGALRLEQVREHGLFPSTEHFNVGIVGPDGVLITNTIVRPDRLQVSDRTYFTAQVTADQDRLFIGPPAQGRPSGKSVIHFSRRIVTKDGDFAGVARASISPAYLTASYDKAALGAHDLIALINMDGEVRVVRSGDKVYRWNESSFKEVPKFGAGGGSAYLSGNDWFEDDRGRYVGWDPIEGHGLIAVAGIDAEAAMQPYRQLRAETVERGWVNTAVLALATLVSMAANLRLRWRKRQFELIQDAYRTATEGGSDGFYIVRPQRDGQGAVVDFRVMDCNARGARFLQRDRSALIGKTVSEIYPASSLADRIRLLAAALDAGSLDLELEEPGDSPAEPAWVHLRAVRVGDDLAVTIRDITEAKKHVEALEQRSNEDALTGLPNRRWVQHNLPLALQARSGAMVAVLFVDLDGFKAVNDALGHEAGDEVLRNAARRLTVAVRPHDRVARLGGDEFLVILEDIAERADAARVAGRILQAFSHKFRLEQGSHSVGTSIGIAMYPEDGVDAETLLRHADIAMYSVKTSGKRSYRFFDEKFYDALRAELKKEDELRQAIEQDQFVMYYQPRVDISTGTVSSMEALVRWIHPARGLVGPDDFIPLAEKTGLILPLGEAVIDKVCGQLAQWAGNGGAIVPVSINVSSRQFNDTDVSRILAAALERHRIDSALIEVELTESSMMGDTDEVLGALSAIQKMGVKLLVDDFGTGYSSLSQLQRMDFDVLKVDRVFTAELGHTEEGSVFFRAIVTMAHALGMRVVAEGVENHTQIGILKELRCDEIQGFLISKPVPPSEIQPLLPRRLLSPVA